MRPPPMRWIALLLGVGLCLAPVPRVAPAASETGEPHTVQPERPTIATHAHTVAPGWVEVESGLERDHFADASRGLTGSLVAKVGLARRLQLNVLTLRIAWTCSKTAWWWTFSHLGVKIGFAATIATCAAD